MGGPPGSGGPRKHWHAWRNRARLNLNEIECLRTRRILINHIAMGTIGLCSVLLALFLPERQIGLAGFFYFVIPVYFTAAGFILGRRECRLIRSMASSATELTTHT